MMRSGLPEIMERENNINRPKPCDFICGIGNIPGTAVYMGQFGTFGTCQKDIQLIFE